MVERTLPRSNLSTASLVERKEGLPYPELEDGPGADITVEDTTVIEAPGLNIEMEDDGGVVIDFDPRSKREGAGDFYDNIAEDMEDRDLGKISTEIMDAYENNKNSRKDWEETYTNGLELLGFKYEESPTVSRSYRSNTSFTCGSCHAVSGTGV